LRLSVALSARAALRLAAAWQLIHSLTPAMSHMPYLLLVASVVLVGVRPSAAEDAQPVPQQPWPQQPVYRCAEGSEVTYTHVPCTGGKPVGEGRVSRTFHPVPPQDRARQMARAQLPPETRQKCEALEADIRQREARLKERTEPPMPAEEGDLAILRVHYREMRC
jgi:hypothetical protein